MSDSNIANVSLSMITLLRKQMEDLVPNPDHIVLLSPADVDEQGQDIRLTLYLYKVLQNPIIKNRPKLKVNHVQRRYPPLTLDLYYLLTTHAPRNNNPDDRALEEQRLLGRAMRVLYDNAILFGSRLLEELAELSGSELRITLNPISVEDLTRIWSVFPNRPYKSSVSYLVSPVPVESTRTTDDVRVLKKETDHRQMVADREEGQ